MIDVAIGQSHLLINKKFEQFRSLIDRCAENISENPVTCEDLHGFWDMVYIQVRIMLNILTVAYFLDLILKIFYIFIFYQVVNLNKRFENLKSMKNNNWEEILPVEKEVKKQKPVKKAKTKSKSALRDIIKGKQYCHSRYF